MPSVEALVEQAEFVVTPWFDAWGAIASAAEAAEWRATAARLLASYPEHPGLLIGRGLAEVYLADGDLREFEFNIQAGITAAGEKYGVDRKNTGQILDWLVRRTERRAGDACITLCAIARNLGVASPAVDTHINQTWTTGSVPAAALGLVDTLEKISELVIELDERTR